MCVSRGWALRRVGHPTAKTMTDTHEPVYVCVRVASVKSQWWGEIDLKFVLTRIDSKNKRTFNSIGVYILVCPQKQAVV